MPPEVAPEPESLSASPTVPTKEDKKETTSNKVLKSSISPPISAHSSKSVDDDDQIDLLLYNVNEKLTQLQQYSQELMSLRLILLTHTHKILHKSGFNLWLGKKTPHF